MKAIEFIRDYESYLSLRGIENGLDIPIGTLRRSILEGRIPDKHEKKIVDKFTFLTRDPLSAELVVVKPVAKEMEVPVVAKRAGDRLPDLHGDGSFDMDKWEKLSIRMYHRVLPIDSGFIEKGKKYYPV